MSERKNIFDVEGARYDAWFDTPEDCVLFESKLAGMTGLDRAPAVAAGNKFHGAALTA